MSVTEIHSSRRASPTLKEMGLRMALEKNGPQLLSKWIYLFPGPGSDHAGWQKSFISLRDDFRNTVKDVSCLYFPTSG